jgi:hypothetical protein
MKMKEFFETVPPYKEVEIEDIYIYNSRNELIFNKPNIYIFCEECGGERNFYTNSSFLFPVNKIEVYDYTCANCNKSKKYFSVIIEIIQDKKKEKMKLKKIGEFPVFGPPTPPKLISLIGPDKDNFLKGRRCEFQSLGIGSYAYYRRVVESQKDRIIDQIIKICEQDDKNSELIKQLESAKSETRFSKAVDIIKKNLPTSLLIEGHNPLKLLHTALSKGIHDMTDDECLNKANYIRLILIKLCLKINELLDDNNELKKAIDSLSKSEQDPPHA